MIRALLAAAVATGAVAAFIYANAIFGYLPQFDLLGEIADFNLRLGLPASLQALWLTHVVVGVLIFGAAFAVLEPILPGNSVGEGAVFGLLTWLTMMLVFMPLAGHAIFAQDLGPLVIVATLGLHLLYGIVLGITNAAFTANPD